MKTYLVEFKMMWAGKVVREGVEQTAAHSEYQAQKNIEEFLRSVNRKAEIHFGDTVIV
jgi:hypothetical protein